MDYKSAKFHQNNYISISLCIFFFSWINIISFLFSRYRIFLSILYFCLHFQWDFYVIKLYIPFSQSQLLRNYVKIFLDNESLDEY